MSEPALEDLLRDSAPQVLGALVRRYGHFDLSEDAVQEALLAASQQWPSEGRPDNPRAWLITVASRRLTDLLRKEQARRRREETAAQLSPETRWSPGSQRSPGSEWSPDSQWSPDSRWSPDSQWLPGSRWSPDSQLSPDSRWSPDSQWLPGSRWSPLPSEPVADSDDTLILLFLCCHPSLSAASQIALTLRAVGGLTTAEIARAFLVPEATMTRRISRAKQSVKAAGARFSLPPAPDQAERLEAVLKVAYLIFNEGYASTTGPSLQRIELAAEGIRLARMLHQLLPDDSEVAGLLALMLLTDARRPARTGPGGELIPMDEQDRTLWIGSEIAEGIDLITKALPRGPVGPYQLQAAIAAVHDEAPSSEQTDWPQIVALYEVLLQLTDNPMVALNHAVAVAMAHGPTAGLALLAQIETDARIAEDHRLFAVRAHLLELSGNPEQAKTAYQQAASRTTSLPQQRYLHTKITTLNTNP